MSRTTIIGNIASRVSIYETRASASAARALSRGVNLIQLRQDAGIWRVHSLLWQEELDTTLQAGLEKALGFHA